MSKRTTSTPPAKADPSAPSRNPTARTITLAVVAAYRETLERTARLVNSPRPDEAEPLCSTFQGLACDLDVDAEHRMLAAVLGWGGDISSMDTCNAHEVRRPPRGLVLDGTLYVAYPDPNEGGKPDGKHSMRLLSLPAASITNLDDYPGEDD